LRLISVLFFVLTLTACSAALVPYTSDPNQKVAQAKWLFEEKHRAIPAEKLLNEAKAIYLEKNDEAGLAELNRVYGLFLNSYAVERWQEKYKENGFIEPEVTFENRFTKSIEYFEKAEVFHTKNENYGELTNIYLRMGFTYSNAGNVDQACSKLDKSIVENTKFMERNPDAKIELDGYPSYRAYVIDRKVRFGCQ
jgi:tetratricopeptide (TPR) repeat protein